MLPMWTRLLDFTYHNMIPASLVGCASRKAILSTTPARDVGISHLRRAFRRVFLYIPASGGSGMQISPPDTVTNSPFGVVLQQGWRGDDSRTRPQSHARRVMLTDRPTAHASPLAPGVRGDSTYSLSLALR